MSIVWTVVCLLLLSPNGYGQSQCIDLFTKAPGDQVNFVTQGFLTVTNRVNEILQKWMPRKTYVSDKVAISDEMSQELRHAQAVFLQNQAAQQLDHSGRILPQIFNLQGQIFRVTSVLGVGGEGEAFLVQSMGQTYVIKKFHDANRIQENLHQAFLLKRKGINVVLPMELDLQQGLVLFPYVNGLDLSEILAPEYSLAPKLPISKSTVRYIKNAYELYAREHVGIPAAQIKQNVVLDLQKNEFIIVDAK